MGTPASRALAVMITMVNMTAANMEHLSTAVSSHQATMLLATQLLLCDQTCLRKFVKQHNKSQGLCIRVRHVKVLNDPLT